MMTILSKHPIYCSFWGVVGCFALGTLLGWGIALAHYQHVIAETAKSYQERETQMSKDHVNQIATCAKKWKTTDQCVER